VGDCLLLNLAYNPKIAALVSDRVCEQNKGLHGTATARPCDVKLNARIFSYVPSRVFAGLESSLYNNWQYASLKATKSQLGRSNLAVLGEKLLSLSIDQSFEQ
jgi:hypothetical protein